MLLSSLLVSILSLGVVSNIDVDEEYLKEEIIEAREECSATFLTKNGTYISFYYGEPIFERNNNNELVPIEESEDEPIRTNSSYTGSSYISNKYFEVGYSTTYTSSLFLGKSSILDPYGNTPEYQTVYGLTLPTFDTTHNTIRGAGFVLKRKSGSLSSALAYKVNSPTYPNINGTATISKSLIGLVSLTSSYSTLDISDEVNAVISSSSTTSLNILLAGTANNGTCYLYRATDGISNRPYFYIEYDNYGNTRNLYDGSDLSINCFGYALFLQSGRNIHSDLVSYGLTNSNCETTMQSFFSYYSNLFGVSDIYRISSYNSQIPANYRRIAFKFYIDSLGNYTNGYHFMWQYLGGGWADKSGFVYTYGWDNSEDAPENSNHWINNNGEYNSSLYYFAILQSI